MTKQEQTALNLVEMGPRTVLLWALKNLEQFGAFFMRLGTMLDGHARLRPHACCFKTIYGSSYFKITLCNRALTPIISANYESI